MEPFSCTCQALRPWESTSRQTCPFCSLSSCFLCWSVVLALPIPPFFPFPDLHSVMHTIMSCILASPGRVCSTLLAEQEDGDRNHSPSFTFLFFKMESWEMPTGSYLCVGRRIQCNEMICTCLPLEDCQKICADSTCSKNIERHLSHSEQVCANHYSQYFVGFGVSPRPTCFGSLLQIHDAQLVQPWLQTISDVVHSSSELLQPCHSL